MAHARRFAFTILGSRSASACAVACALLAITRIHAASREPVEPPAAGWLRMARPTFCWSPGTPPETMAAFELPGRDRLSPSWYLIQGGERWTVTATNGPGIQRGDPVVLTWGFLPDGTNLGTVQDPVPSRLIQVMDSQYGEGPGGTDLTQRPWFPLFQQVFDRWSDLIGVTYIYEPADDGANFDGAPGLLGVRPDVRIASVPIDGNDGYNIYGFNFAPDSGDMVLDSDNASNFGSRQYDSRFLRNLVAHEHGHGLGLAHSCPIEHTKLMEPTLTMAIDGPQHDDILGANRGYGDGWEGPSRNDTFDTAAELGSLDPGDTLRIAQVTIDGDEDVDYYAFTVPPTMRISAAVTPVGFRYFNSPGDASDCPLGWYFDSLRQNNLGLELVGTNGTGVLASAAYRPLGQGESVENLLLTEGGGTYFVRAFADTDNVQMYDLWITASAGQAPVAMCKIVNSCQPLIDEFRVNDGSYDPDGDDITLTLYPEAPFPVGTTEVMLIASDGFNADTCYSAVTINGSPTAVGGDLIVEGDTLSNCEATVPAAAFDNGSFDPDGDALAFAAVPTGPYSPGATPVQFIVTDRCGASDTVEVTVTVTCTVPVVLSSFTAQRRGEVAVISWTVADAEDHSGFHVHRRLPGSERERLTPALLSGRETYEFTDGSVPRGPVEYWLEELSRTGRTTWYGPAALDAAAASPAVALGVSPNPFAGRTTVSYTVAETQGVTLDVFDVSGRRVRTLVDRVQETGEHRLTWDGRGDDGSGAVPGLYVLRLVAGDAVTIRKAVLLPGR